MAGPCATNAARFARLTGYSKIMDYAAPTEKLLTHDGYWQSLSPCFRYMGEMQWKRLPIESRVRYSWAVRKFVWSHPRRVCIAKVVQADFDVIPLYLVWRLWIEIGESND